MEVIPENHKVNKCKHIALLLGSKYNFFRLCIRINPVSA